MLGRDIGRASVAAYRSLSLSTVAGGAELLSTPSAPFVPMLNRVVGLGSVAAATEPELDAALALVPPGTTFYVSLEPTARPPELPSWLLARGFEPGRDWMRFARATADAPQPESALRLVRIEDAVGRSTFSRIACQGFGLPAASADALGIAPDAGWECWLACDGAEPIGAGALFVSDGVGYLGIGATLSSHRGKGAQSLLLAHRIRRAAELSCDTAVTETGVMQDGVANGSYRNILRAGFVEVDALRNWVSSR